ncbi:unnamed protein product [Symbiodinium sp. CCMP2592]|nr:unnamed protein product [Symbiodinium sp. CCMP2592]
MPPLGRLGSEAAKELAAHARGKRWEPACQLLATLQADADFPREGLLKAYSMVMGAAGSHWQLPLQLLDEMQRCSLQADAVCYGAAITACGRGREWVRSLSLFHAAPAQTLVAYNATISALSRSQQWPLALHLFGRLPEADVVSFNATMTGCGQGRQWHLTLELFDEMARRSLPPDKITFGALADTCERAGKWDLVLSLVNRLADGAVRPDNPIFGSLISACERGHRWQEALSFLAQMRCAALEPSSVLQGVAIGACIKGQELHQGLALHQALLAQGTVPHAITNSSLVSACVQQGRWAEVLRLVETKGILNALTPPAMSAGLLAAEVLHAWEVALALVSQLRRAADRVPVASLLAAAGACAKAGKARLAATMFRQVPGILRGRPLAEHNAAMASAGRARFWTLALSLFDDLHLHSLEPDRFSLANIVVALDVAWQGSLALLQGREALADVVVYSALMRSCERAHAWEVALDVFRNMQHAGVEPNSVALCAALSALAAGSRWREALQILPTCPPEIIAVNATWAVFKSPASSALGFLHFGALGFGGFRSLGLHADGFFGVGDDSHLSSFHVWRSLT